MRARVRARPLLPSIAALCVIAAPARARAQVNPGIWRPVPQSVADTMSLPTLRGLHRRLLAHEDSLIRYGTALLRHGVPWRRGGREAHGPLSAGTYGALVAGAVLYNAACPLGPSACERDPGGYVDGYASIDKVAHASTALALTSLAVQGGVPRGRAALVTLAGGVAFELTQARGGGYYSSRDVVANSAGVAAAWGWSAWVDRRRSRAAARPRSRDR